jgi:hypothetical protein
MQVYGVITQPNASRQRHPEIERIKMPVYCTSTRTSLPAGPEKLRSDRVYWL